MVAFRDGEIRLFNYNMISASLEKSSEATVLIRFFFILWLRDDPELKRNQSRIVPGADLIN